MRAAKQIIIMMMSAKTNQISTEQTSKDVPMQGNCERISPPSKKWCLFRADRGTVMRTVTVRKLMNSYRAAQKSTVFIRGKKILTL